MIDGSFAYVFGLGMFAAFNPCGFAMLPAYLAYFTGAEASVEDESPDTFRAVLRALAVGATMTAGFIAVFAIAGTAIETVSGAFQEHLSWVTMIIGLLLFGLGLAYLLGKEVYLRLPHLDRGGDSRELRSMFVFGVSYALASLSCTIPVFLAVIPATFENESFVSGVASFVVYGLGMGLVITFLTVCIALARQGVVRHLRRVLPYVGRVAGLLLMLAGAYMVWYGWWEEQTLSNNEVAEGPVGLVTTWSGNVETWIREFGALRLGLIMASTLGIIVVLTWGWRASRPRPAVARPADGAVTSEASPNDSAATEPEPAPSPK